jgi:prophage antirepressor-like protein
MKEILPFTFPTTGQTVRTVVIDGEPWFVAADVCAVLGISNSRQALSYLDEDEKGVITSDTPGGPQQMAIVSEAGLYSLILRSRKSEAKVFKRWVTHEVLPAIRKTGSYSVVPIELPRSFAEALELAARQARALEDAEGRASVAEHQLHEISPAAKCWSALADAHGDYALRDAAQILSRDPLIVIGQNQLMIYLKNIGWVDAKGEPYQHQVKAGRLVRRSTSYDHPHTGEPKLSYQVRITPKGLAELHKRLGGFGDVANVVAA